eukprot:TRINITY_DN10732_c0_g2_i1.p1 TRINITY_DN10732_c0_g2~~TRINITY_DN10732_c0_g2_i1.p1  ORF type:complete len:862 (-),score=153.47 TRINITY_DN10732_c0_g2_i1:79-2664(-)
MATVDACSLYAATEAVCQRSFSPHQSSCGVGLGNINDTGLDGIRLEIGPVELFESPRDHGHDGFDSGICDRQLLTLLDEICAPAEIGSIVVHQDLRGWDESRASVQSRSPSCGSCSTTVTVGGGTPEMLVCCGPASSLSTASFDPAVQHHLAYSVRGLSFEQPVPFSRTTASALAAASVASLSTPSEWTPLVPEGFEHVIHEGGSRSSEWTPLFPEGFEHVIHEGGSRSSRPDFDEAHVEDGDPELLEAMRAACGALRERIAEKARDNQELPSRLKRELKEIKRREEGLRSKHDHLLKRLRYAEEKVSTKLRQSKALEVKLRGRLEAESAACEKIAHAINGIPVWLHARLLRLGVEIRNVSSVQAALTKRLEETADMQATLQSDLGTERVAAWRQSLNVAKNVADNGQCCPPAATLAALDAAMTASMAIATDTVSRPVCDDEHACVLGTDVSFGANDDPPRDVLQKFPTWHGDCATDDAMGGVGKSVTLGKKHRKETTVLDAAKTIEQLDAELADCERSLSRLQTLLLESNDGTSNLPSGRRALRAECLSLSLRLEALTADALECGCRRDVPGAMDVFEHATDAIDRVVTIMQSCVSGGDDFLQVQFPAVVSTGPTPSCDHNCGSTSPSCADLLAEHEVATDAAEGYELTVLQRQCKDKAIFLADLHCRFDKEQAARSRLANPGCIATRITACKELLSCETDPPGCRVLGLLGECERLHGDLQRAELFRCQEIEKVERCRNLIDVDTRCVVDLQTSLSDARSSLSTHKDSLACAIALLGGVHREHESEKSVVARETKKVLEQRSVARNQITQMRVHLRREQQEFRRLSEFRDARSMFGCCGRRRRRPLEETGLVGCAETLP